MEQARKYLILNKKKWLNLVSKALFKQHRPRAKTVPKQPSCESKLKKKNRFLKKMKSIPVEYTRMIRKQSCLIVYMDKGLVVYMKMKTAIAFS